MRHIPYGRQLITKEDIRAVIEVLQSDWITQGPKIKEFEDALCKYTGAKYAVVVSSGTAALHIACLAADIKTGDEVVTSPITFAASANCVLYCGGRPVFADIQESTANIDPKEIMKKINKRTRAIIPIHFAGYPCDLEEINKIAKKHNLIVIEDAAHALGAEYKNSKIGSCKYSDMATLSFHPVKSITTGEGGAVLTNRKNLYENLVMLRNHGITKERNKIRRFQGPWYYEMQSLGFNYRITDYQCVLGIKQLEKLNQFIERRREIAQIYIDRLSSIQEIRLPAEKDHVKSAWHLYPIQLNNKPHRDRLFSFLRRKGINVQLHYIPVYLHPYYQQFPHYKREFCPRAEQFYNQEITIPIYPSLKMREINYVIRNLAEYFNKKIQR